VTSVSSVTNTKTSSESVPGASQAKSLVKCPESECHCQVEPFYMKVHLENKHGIAEQLQIRESEKSEYLP
jgi:hypothetical protein